VLVADDAGDAADEVQRPSEDQRNMYAPEDPPEHLAMARHRRAAYSQVIEVIEVTSEEPST
jgi:hypothetical protein